MSTHLYKLVIVVLAVPFLLFAWVMAIGLTSERTKVMYVRAYELYAQGDWENAITQLQLVNDRDEIPGALFQLGCAQEMIGREHEAMSTWRHCIFITSREGPWGIWATERLHAAKRRVARNRH